MLVCIRTAHDMIATDALHCGRSSTTSPQSLTVSLLIRAARGGEALARCLFTAVSARIPTNETIVVVDGAEVAATRQVKASGVQVLPTPPQRGPAAVRSHGAARAQGQVLFFVDSDVVIPGDAVDQVRRSSLADPEFRAVFSSHDDAPDTRCFLSQYKGLVHRYVHQRGGPDASAFWAGCLPPRTCAATHA
jgi:glycosyltransferase involved in cell wall biosynthesis